MNTTHTHTPGPWQTARRHAGRDIFKEERRDFETKEVKFLAFMVRNEDYLPVEESDANARLMTAAPDMLAALDRAAEHFKRHGTAETQGIACDVFKAIAKARGST